MRELSRTVLTLLAAVLALWLVLGFWPLSTVSRSVLSVCILLVCSAALWHRWRRRQFVSIPVTEHSLPPEDFQGAVVLVCGDTAALFSPDTAYRETRQGWYLHAQNAEQLLLLAQHLAAVRPALVSQVSVLLALIPEQQTSEEALAQTLRGWRRSIAQCRSLLNGVPPVWSVVWVSPPALHHEGEAQWFTVTPGLPGVRVRQNGHVALPVTDWQRESGSRASRLHDTLWLESILALTAHHLTRPLSVRQGELPQLNLCATGICLIPVAAIADNLWQQQIAGITTLCPQPVFAADLLPLPEVLLPHLPRRHGISRRMQDMRLAGGISFAFLALAMLASFINNQRLVRSVGDHLVVYHRLSGTPPEPKQQAQQRLQADSRLLDDWLRRGQPLRYGLGLYQGMRLIPPVEAAINSWTPPAPPRPVIKKIVQGPQTVRLNSMSLFDTGKWQLKPGSTKLLVNSLVGIKAKPGWLIVVAGHTDSTGEEQSNQVLSLKRAESVRDWMRDTGDVPESCFAVQGYGESRPVATNDTADGRALNRRVEISLVPQANACQAPGNTLAPSQDDDVSKNEME
ncbi:ompA family protein [Enterobacter genomosp. O]|uniref:OmpA family protein n=1 Tax=Enterobacter genomosp. O TaxID=2364150 RepID=UPI00064338C8|nr:OmpA family protein [Enterobacter genomosp. O]KLP52842.1 ompA family protein [Enterobacter genomosp. O]